MLVGKMLVWGLGVRGSAERLPRPRPRGCDGALETLGRGDDTVGNPHQAQISQFDRAQVYQCELFELIFLLKLDKQFPSNNSRRRYLSQQYPPPLLEGALETRGRSANGADMVVPCPINRIVGSVRCPSFGFDRCVFEETSKTSVLLLLLSIHIYIYIYTHIYIYIYR